MIKPQSICCSNIPQPVAVHCSEARVYRGGGWRDLFAEKTSFDKVRWMTVSAVTGLAANERCRTNDDCTFRLWFCAPGLIHVEYDDDGRWTVQDIFRLPRWMVVG